MDRLVCIPIRYMDYNVTIKHYRNYIYQYVKTRVLEIKNKKIPRLSFYIIIS